MKKNNIYLTELNNTFSEQDHFSKSELRDFYQDLYEDFDENTFRRIIYSLERDKVITKIDRGIYLLNKNNEQAWHLRKKFIPAFSPDVISITNIIRENFPYTITILWETRILLNFMRHQPGQNLIVLETEKESIESIFNFLENKFTGRVFLDPSQDIVEKYALRNTNSILILPMISRSPRQIVNGVPCPKIEKILVDIWSDKSRFFMFHGRELVNIYETIFQNYQISEKTLFGYAKRRKVDKKIRSFMIEKTDIQLIQSEDDKR
jgi:hypothetical protein